MLTVQKGFSPLGAATDVQVCDSGVLFNTFDSQIRVTVLADDLLRVHMTRHKRDPSYESVPPSFSVVDRQWPTPNVAIDDGPDMIRISTPAMAVEVTKAPVRVSFLCADGKVMCADSPEKGMGWMDRGAGCYRTFRPDTHFYGFGERTGYLDKRGTAMTLWNTDINPHTPATDSLYISIPFFVAFTGDSAYGMLLDTAARSVFNMGKPRPEITGPPEGAPWPNAPWPNAPWPDPGEYWFGTEGPELDYYFFAGPDIDDIVRRYSDLTGRMELPPLWALGYHQCRWSYRPDTQVEEVAHAFREADIPCDAIYLDIHYMDGYRVFTFDPARFPNPGGLADSLASRGFKLVTIVDPGVKVDPKYRVYAEGKTKGFYVKTRDGEELHGQVWPGTSAYPDFTEGDVRSWWADNHSILFRSGVRGIWNDMNEPACFGADSKTIPEDSVHGHSGSEFPHAYVHNAYGNLMARATREAFNRMLPGVRPFVITRAGCSGIQRDACVWTGDNSSCWEHLLMSVPMCLNLSMSGVSFVGADVGGFLSDADPELVTRWTQLGAFVPLFRNHSVVGSVYQEPCRLGEPFTSICRKFIKLRYRLIPYLYTLMRQCSIDGTPMMRPLVYHYPHDEAVHAMYDQFMLGDSMMVAPVYLPSAECRPVYFPAGRWANLFTGEVTQAGGASSHSETSSRTGGYSLISAPLDLIPVFLREGAILPWGRVMNYVGEKEQALEIIDIFPSMSVPRGSFPLYVDDGQTDQYKSGKFGFIDISYSFAPGAPGAAERTCTIDIDARDSGYPCVMPVGTVRIWDVDAAPSSVAVNGRQLRQADGPADLAADRTRGSDSDGGSGDASAYYYDCGSRRLYVGVNSLSKGLRIAIES